LAAISRDEANISVPEKVILLPGYIQTSLYNKEIPGWIQEF
jgi:hypothetical protein